MRKLTPPANRTPVFRAFTHVLIGLCSGTLLAPRAAAEVSVWGGGSGFSDSPANWAQGVLPAPGDSIVVPGGSMFARGLVASNLAVRAGAQTVVLAEGGPGLSIAGPSDSEPNSQPLLGTLFVGSANAPGELFLTNSIFFNGEGRFRLTHPLSLVAADPGAPSSRLGIEASSNCSHERYFGMYFLSRGPKSLLFTPSALVGGGGDTPSANITLWIAAIVSKDGLKFPGREPSAINSGVQPYLSS